MTFLFNMGLPMIVPVMYFMVITLIPIVTVEAGYLSKRLNIPFRNTVGSVAFGNVLSTVVGIPATWFLLVVVQFVTGGSSGYEVSGFWRKFLSVTLQAPWLLPAGENESWIFPTAALFLLVPFFFATWLFEYVVVRNKLAARIFEIQGDGFDLKDAERMVFRGVRNANFISYSLIALLPGMILLFTVLR